MFGVDVTEGDSRTLLGDTSLTQANTFPIDLTEAVHTGDLDKALSVTFGVENTAPQVES